LSGSLVNFQNIPGALSHAISIAAEKSSIDIVLIDLSPSLGSLNQNLLMSSDGFIIPMAPDFFSGMALRSLSTVLPAWANWSASASNHQILRSADYPWRQRLPKYVGSIVQNYRRRSREGHEVRPTRAFQKWFRELEEIMHEPLMQSFQQAGLLLELSSYDKCCAPSEKFLVEVPDFNSLIAISQDLSKPVFSLTKDEIKTSGSVASNQLANVEQFNGIYDGAAQKIKTLAEEIKSAF
jgi:hypothetical protein